jgi:hypothetical protein
VADLDAKVKAFQEAARNVRLLNSELTDARQLVRTKEILITRATEHLAAAKDAMGAALAEEQAAVFAATEEAGEAPLDEPEEAEAEPEAAAPAAAKK